MKQIWIGTYLFFGAILASIIRLSGLRPPTSNTAYSRGSDHGYWIGTGIGIVIGLGMIAQGVIARKKDRGDSEAKSLIERLSAMEISNTTYAIIIVVLTILLLICLKLFYPGFGQ